MSTLYVIPFMGIGRRLTLSVDFRYRGSLEHRDVHVIEFSRVWHKDPFGSLTDLIDEWASSMLVELEKAQSEGYRLADNRKFGSIAQLIYELESIRTLIGYGYGDRASAVEKFLLCLHNCDPTAF